MAIARDGRTAENEIMTDSHFDENAARKVTRLGARRPRVVLVNTNQVKPTIAPIAFDYLHEPLVEAGFDVDLLDLCFSEDYEQAIAEYCRTRRVDYWGVTLR